jgi:hypothetical protein
LAERHRQQALAARDTDSNGKPRVLDLRIRKAIIVGVKGKLGEALLNQLLASSYLAVTAIADKPLTLGIARLSVAALGEINEGQADDAFLCLSDPDAAYGQSYYGRDAHFSTLLPPDIFEVAKGLVAKGVTRLILISPLSSWHQMSPSAKGISSELESRLLSLELESLLILRPATESQSQPQTTSFRRFLAGYFNIFRIMLPKGAENLRTDQLARSAIKANQDAPAGVQVLNNEDLIRMLS